jgi:hypothetical protein
MLPILLMRHYDGIVKFAGRRHSREPSGGMGFIGAAIGLWIRSCMNWPVDSWGHFWAPFITVSLVTVAVWLVTVPEVRRDVAAGFLCYLFCAAYGYGVVLNVNGMLATAPYERYTALLENKYVLHGRNTSYYFTLGAWGPWKIAEDVAVSPEEYDSRSIGDTISVTMREGAFGIPNFWVR